MDLIFLLGGLLGGIGVYIATSGIYECISEKYLGKQALKKLSILEILAKNNPSMTSKEFFESYDNLLKEEKEEN